MTIKSLPMPTGSLEKYLQEINCYPLLTPTEEEELARKWVDHQNIEAAHHLTTSNLRFVVKISYEYRRYGIRLADLIQEGNIGLIMAIKKFDPDRGVRLISYAVWWIRAQIQNFILQSWRLVKIGTTQAQRKLFYKLEKTKRMLARLHGNTERVKRKDVAKALNVREELVEEMEQRLGAQEVSLDGRFKIDVDEVRSLAEILPDNTPSPEEKIVEAEYEELRKHYLSNAMEKLSDRERLIIYRRKLIESPETLSEIGKILGITRERVRQLEARALRKLRTFLSEEKVIGMMVPYEKVLVLPSL